MQAEAAEILADVRFATRGYFLSRVRRARHRGVVSNHHGAAARNRRPAIASQAAQLPAQEGISRRGMTDVGDELRRADTRDSRPTTVELNPVEAVEIARPNHRSGADRQIEAHRRTAANPVRGRAVAVALDSTLLVEIADPQAARQRGLPQETTIAGGQSVQPQLSR